ncbi:MAG: FAD-dependent oxidoreductase [Pirellulales bacterium]
MARSLFLFASLAFAVTCPQRASAAEPESYDVVVYGATSGGVTAAVQSARLGRTVVLVEPSQHVGGLTSGGLGTTDIGNKGAIGGMSREFYRRLHAHYQKTDSWTVQTPDEYWKLRKGGKPQEDTMWTFEPHVAERIYREMLDEAKVPLVFGERLDLRRGSH